MLLTSTVDMTNFRQQLFEAQQAAIASRSIDSTRTITDATRAAEDRQVALLDQLTVSTNGIAEVVQNSVAPGQALLSSQLTVVTQDMQSLLTSLGAASHSQERGNLLLQVGPASLPLPEINC